MTKDIAASLYIIWSVKEFHRIVGQFRLDYDDDDVDLAEDKTKVAHSFDNSTSKLFH